MAEQLAAGPDSHSSDYDASAPYWNKVNDVLAGSDAMRSLSTDGSIGHPIQLQNVPQQQFAQGRGFDVQSPYLPKLPNEPYNEYARRVSNSFLTNIYSDISENLSSKPFSKECSLAEDTGDDLKKLAENIDGLGNNLHVFARETFKTALDKAIAWIMVDYTKVPVGANLAEERDMGARPYWVSIPAERIIAFYSKFLNGKEVYFHARIEEPCTELEGYEEVTKNRIRILNRDPITNLEGTIIGFAPATWAVHEEGEEEKTDSRGIKYIEKTWTQIDGGPITIGIIPMVPVIFGKRQGTSWRIDPPLRDILGMQIKLFQMESNLDYTKELTAFPMLSGSGVKGSDDSGAAITVPVGPRAVLFAPPDGTGNHGEWKFIEPGGSSLTFLQSDINAHKTEMRDLGKQPLTTANLTVITTANVSMKAHSVCQAWALAEKDALEQAWKITTMWLNQPSVEPVVSIHTDFAIEIGAETDKDWLLSATDKGYLSPQTLREEAKRRAVLSDDFTEEEEQKRLAKHQANEILTPEVHIDPVTGHPIVVTPKEGKLNPPPPKPAPAKKPTVN